MTAHRSLEEALQQKDTATELYLSDLSKIPKEIGQLANLEVLGLGKCNLSKLPDELASLGKLRKLYLGGGKLKEVPPLLLGLASLEVLALSECPLAELPSLAGLPNLHTLEMSSTKIIDVSALSTAPGLRFLRYCYPKAIPHRDALDFIEKLSHLETLDMSAYGSRGWLERAPSAEALPRLRHLDIGTHAIADLPASYRNLPLESLDIASTKIKKLPDFAPSLARLVAFYAPLVDLGDLANLPALHTLELRLQKKLAALPEGEWPALRVLRLESMPVLRGLPKALLRSKTLENVIIESCPEMELPDDVDWPALKSVRIFGLKRAPSPLPAPR